MALRPLDFDPFDDSSTTAGGYRLIPLDFNPLISEQEETRRDITKDFASATSYEVDDLGVRNEEKYQPARPPRLPDPSKPEDTFWDAQKKSFQNLVPWTKKFVGGLTQALSESDPTAVTGLEGMGSGIPAQTFEHLKTVQRQAAEQPDSWAKQVVHAAEQDLRANQPNVDPESLKGMAAEVTTVVGQMVPSIVASLVTKSPAIGLGIMGGQVYGGQYGEARAEGMSPERADAEAKFYAAAETLTELPFIDNLIKLKAKNFFPTLLKSMGIESIGEGINQAVEQAYEAKKLSSTEGGSFVDAWNKLGGWDSVRHAMTIGAAAAVPFHGVAYGLDRLRGVPQDGEGGSGAGTPPPGANPQPTAPDKINPNLSPEAQRVRIEPTFAQAPLTPEEAANPLPNDLQAEGKAILQAVQEGRPLETLVQPPGSTPPPGAPPAPVGALNEPRPAPIETIVPRTIVTEPPKEPAESATPPVMRRDGTPFPTEGEARLAAKSRKDLKGKGYSPVQVDGGWGLSLPPAAKPAAPTAPPVQGVAPVAVPPPAAESSSSAAGATAPAEPHTPHTDEGIGTAKQPVEINSAADLDAVKPRIAPEPTDGQKSAENYASGHGTWNGLGLTFENFPGGTRRSKADDPVKWEVKMPAYYGRIKKTEGADSSPEDKQGLDFYMGPNPESRNVYVVDQYDLKTQGFDEHKLMLGFNSQKDAEAAYDAAFSDGKGPKRRVDVIPMTVEQLKAWLKEGDTKQPLADQAPEETQPQAVVDWTERGREDFKAGKNSTPPADARAAGLEAMEAWTKAWHAANLAAPVPGVAAPPVKAKAEPQAESGVDALTYLASRGGLRDDEGHRLKESLDRPIPGHGRLIRSAGNSVDKAGEILWDAGYFGPTETSPRPSEREVLGFLDKAGGTKTYLPEIQAKKDEESATAMGENRAQMEQIASEYGIDPSGKTDQELETLLDAERVWREEADALDEMSVAAIEAELGERDTQADESKVPPFEDTRAPQEGAGERTQGNADRGGQVAPEKAPPAGPENGEGRQEPPRDRGPSEKAVAGPKADRAGEVDFRKNLIGAKPLGRTAVFFEGTGIELDPLSRIITIGDEVPRNKSALEAAKKLKSDPQDGRWRDVQVSATLDDGDSTEVSAGQAADLIAARLKNAYALLECLR